MVRKKTKVKMKMAKTRFPNPRLGVTAAVLLLTILLASSISLALEWTQITPTPTTNNIVEVHTTSTAAMAVTTSATNILYFNGTTWFEVSQPPNVVGYTFVDFDSTRAGKFYFIYKNTTNDQQFRARSFAIATNWTDEGSYVPPAGYKLFDANDQESFVCQHRTGTGNKCLLALNDTATGEVAYFYGLFGGTDIDAANTTGFTTGFPLLQQLSYQQSLWTNRRASGAGNSLQNYNGVSWVNRGSKSNLQRVSIIDETSTAILIEGTSDDAYYFNSTTGTFNLINCLDCFTSINSTSIRAFTTNPDTNAWYFWDAAGVNAIRKGTIHVTTNSTQVTTVSTTFLGGRYMEINDDSSFGFLVGNSGQIFSFGIGAGNNATTNVSENPTPLVYTLTANSYDQVATQVQGVAPLGDTRSLAIGKIGTNLALLGYDTTTPSNIIFDNYTTTANRAPQSIDSAGDKALLGTDSDVYPFNNTSPGVASEAMQETTIRDGVIFDNVVSVYTVADTLAYGCDIGSISHFLIRYNLTNHTTTSVSSGSNCYDIATGINDTIIYTWQGTSGIKIYNKTLSLVSTQAIVTSIPAASPTDLLSTHDGKIAIVTGRNVVKIYNQTTSTTPTKEWECRIDNDITAVEMLSDTVVAVSTASNMRICNQMDAAQYSSSGDFYAGKQVRTYTGTTYPRDLRRNNDNYLFSSAENSQYTLYQLSIGDLASSNLPPVINDVTVTTTTPCLNQSVYGHIDATDPEGSSALRLYYSCDSTTFFSTTSGDFACSYTTTGTKTVGIQARDEFSTSATSITLSVQGCTANALNFLILNSLNTSQPVSGALVSVIGFTSTTSDQNGFAYINMESPGTYDVSVSKAGFLTQSGSATTNSGRTIVYLEPLVGNDGQSRNSLTVTVVDSDSNPIAFATVSVNDPVTSIAKVQQTNSQGTTTFLDLSTGVNLRVSAGKTGYQAVFDNVVMQEGSTEEITMTLLRTGEITNQTTGRGCQDYVAGILLCSPLNVTGNGDSCQADADCITGRCEPTSGGLLRNCARLNWTYCDDNGFDRGNLCVLKLSGDRAGRNFSGMIIDNLLYVGAFLFILIVMLLIVKSLKGK